MDNKKCRGKWYLPEYDKNVNGEVHFSNEDGIVLRLDSPFPNVLHHLDKLFPIIYGITTTGEKITLLNSWLLLYSEDITEYRSAYLIIGHHLITYDSKDYIGLSFRCDFLKEWIGYNSIRNVTWGNGCAKIECESPQPYRFTISNNISGEVDTNIKVINKKENNDLVVAQQNDIKLYFSKKISFSECLDEFGKFYKFLTFSFQITPGIHELVFEADNLRANIYYANQSFRPGGKSHNFIFELGEVSNFEQIIAKWYLLEEKIDASTDLLFNSYLNGFSFSENAFLNQCQALEILHRRLFTFSANEMKSHNDKVEEILESVNPLHRNWLQEKLSYSHEPSLRMRLKELISTVAELIPIKEIKIDKKMVGIVVENRNYYTHYGQLPSKSILKGQQLLKLTLKLKILHIILLLKELEFQDAEINNLYKNGRFMHMSLAFT